MLAERLRLNANRTVACLLPVEALSNTWWPAKAVSHDIEQLLALWLNSSIGILSLLSIRTMTEGPWVELRKPSLSSLPVPNFGKLKKRQRESLLDLYDRVSRETLLPISEMADDPVRAKIDRGIAAAFELPSLDPLRSAIGREPTVCGKPLYADK
ncbi:MAG: hypothetical protein IT350_02635 [Deltaproteobacteria bacterium]|nr:hypothetical protein [Deltaproteobacteria bacterium]